MKCPQCGQWNRASLPNCIRCGAPLNPESAETPAWQEQFRKEDKEPKTSTRTVPLTNPATDGMNSPRT